MSSRSSDAEPPRRRLAKHSRTPYVYPVMRIVVVALVLVTIACGDRAAEQVLSSASAQPVAVPATATTRPTPRPTTRATRDCSVSWSASYRTLDALVDDSELIVRARAIAKEEVTLKAFGANGAVSYRTSARVTFTVLTTLSASSPQVDEVRVLEDVCPGLDLTPGDEWVLFLRKANPRHGPDAPGDHYFTLGGPQGQARLRGALVSGPFFAFQRGVHQYEGATVVELERDIAAIRAVDKTAARMLVERYGWRVIDAATTSDAELPADSAEQFLLDARPFSDFVAASRRIGLDLGASAPGPVRIVTLQLEADRPSTEKQYTAAVAYRRGQIIGAWVVAGVPWTWSLFALDQRADALILGGRP